MLKPFFDQNSKFFYPLRCLGLLILGAAVYVWTFGFGFVFDDLIFIVHNDYIKRLDHVHYLWQFYPQTRTLGFYSFALNYCFGRLHPLGYHLFNFIIHLCSTFMVWSLSIVLFRISKINFKNACLFKELPFWTAVLFLVHPAQTQAVTYVSQRFESMAALFYFSTVFLYLRGRVTQKPKERILFFTLSALSFGLGLLTKEVIITAPAMVLACEWIFFPAKDPKKLYILGTAGLGLTYLALVKILHTNANVLHQSIWLFPIASDSHDGELLAPGTYLLTQLRVLLTFLRLLLLPAHQNVDYDYPQSGDLLHPFATLIGLIAVIGFIYGIFQFRRSRPLISFGLAWILITFSANLVPRSNVIFEHKLYLISYGFFLALVVTLASIIRGQGRFFQVMLALTAVLALMSIHRNQVWQNEFTLWDDAVKKSPHKGRPYNNRGKSFYAKGQYDLALSDFNKAIALEPGHAEPYNNRGVIFDKLGDTELAITDYNKAIDLDPHYAEAYFNRGLVLSRQGKISEAVKDYTTAIRLRPGISQAYNNRGLLLSGLGHFHAALDDYNQAIDINPDFVEAYNNRGLILDKQGDYPDAVADFTKAIALDPASAEPYNNRGLALAKQGICKEALADFDRAIALKPDYSLARFSRDLCIKMLK